MTVERLQTALIAQFFNTVLTSRLRFTFSQFDDGVNGGLDNQELEQALESLNIDMTMEENESICENDEEEADDDIEVTSFELFKQGILSKKLETADDTQHVIVPRSASRCVGSIFRVSWHLLEQVLNEMDDNSDLLIDEQQCRDAFDFLGIGETLCGDCK